MAKEILGNLKRINDVCSPIIHHLSQYNTLTENMQTLKRKLEHLSSQEADINAELEYAESSSSKKRKKAVENWLRNVERTKIEVYRMEQEVGEMRFPCHVQLGRRIEKMIGEVRELLEHGNSHNRLMLRAQETRGNMLLTTKSVSQTFRRNVDKMWALVVNDRVLSIGIYGMGGVGKTTLAMYIHNHVLESPSTFDNVFWVTVSQDFSILELQNNIAKTLHLDLSKDDDEKKRAAKLAEAFARKKKSVLILDDVWNHFPLELAGIQIRVNGCKLVLTTRSLDVCRRIGCQEYFKVEPLSVKEAWDLFMEELRHDGALCPEIEKIAKRVAKECAGLPLGIITMARSMIRVNDICQWRNTLEELKDSNVGQDSMETEVFHRLKLSYDHLKDPKVQQCFLYCALYPKGFKIRREELIENLMVEGIIEEMKSRQAEFDRGHSLLNKLENSCLLESDTNSLNEKYVSMNDMVRHMALQITRTSPRFMVEAGVKLREIPDEENWRENLERVSFMNNNIVEIPSTVSPECHRLSTLFLLGNSHLRRISDSFFVQMGGLRVIDLSLTGIETLPNSISNLENLTALLLRRCKELRYVPSLAKLRLLRKLDLSYTGIKEVPQGMEMLINLRYLNLYAEYIEMLPAGILSKLSRLRYLILNWGSKTMEVKGEEVAGLTRLETFAGLFSNLHDFNIYVESLHGRGLHNYLLQVGLDEEFISFDDGESYFIKDVRLRGCSIRRSGVVDPLVLPKDVQSLVIRECHDVTSLSSVYSLNNVTDLKRCEISECDGIEYLIMSPSGCSRSLQSLEELKLSYLENFSAICKGGAVPSQQPRSPPGTFSCLKSLWITSCPNIKNLFMPCLLPHLQNVEEIYVEECEQMEEIIADDGIDESGIHETTMISLSKLRVLDMRALPRLKSICGGVMYCEFLQEITICKCPKLKRLPLHLPVLNGQLSPPPVLENIHIDDQSWWEALEWDTPHAKDVFQPLLEFWIT